MMGRLLRIAQCLARGIPVGLGGSTLRNILYRRLMAGCAKDVYFAENVQVTEPAKISVGPESRFMSDCKLYAHESRGLTFGRRCALNHNVTVDASQGGGVRLGDHVMIGPNTILRAADHCFSDPDSFIRDQGHKAGDIIVDDDVWIAANCVITRDVHIGRGTVIGAGSVVTKNVPAGEVWAGNPARFIRKR